MDHCSQPMYQHPGMTMMGHSEMDSVPEPIPINYHMDNPPHGNMGIQGEPMSTNFTNYSQLPVRKEVDEEGRICGVVLSKTTTNLPEEESEDAQLSTEDMANHPIEENGTAKYPVKGEEDDVMLKDSKENIKTEEQDDISIFMETAHDIFLKVSSKEMKIQEASNLLGRPYSFVYTKYQEFLDNITGKATMKKKKKGGKKKGKKEGKSKKGKVRKSGGRFKCEECPAAFPTEYLIKTHTKLHTDKNIESHLCTACGILFSKLGQLMRHRMELHDDALQCPHCEKQYTKISAYKFHVNTHTKSRPFQCNECEKGFFSKVSLEDHHRQHTGERPFMCGYCEKTFVTLSNLKLHQYIHTGGRPNKPKRKKQPKPPKKYGCQECGRRYISQNKLDQHMNTHTGAMPYACELCDARFSLKPNLIRHKRKHTGEKPFKCEHCPTAFAFKSELRLHDMVHTGNKPFKCTQCDYSCVRKSKLDYHMNTHTGERPFKCDFYGCSAEYPSPSTLKQHKLKHGPSPFKICKLCNEKFPDINSLKRHMMIHPGNEPLPCEMCDKIFYNESTLKRHMHVHMYKRPENKPKVIRQRKKNPTVKRPDTTVITQKTLPPEYQAPFVGNINNISNNGHTSVSQSWTINAEDTNSQPQQSYYHSFPASQYTNLNAWPATFDPDELRNRLLASFK